MSAFKKRLDPSSESVGFGDLLPAADLAALTPVDLTEYETIIDNLINRVD